MNTNETATDGKGGEKDVQKHVPTDVAEPAEDAGRDMLPHVPAENPAEDVRKHILTLKIPPGRRASGRRRV